MFQNIWAFFFWKKISLLGLKFNSFYTVVGDYINTIKTTFYFLCFDPKQAFFKSREVAY